MQNNIITSRLLIRPLRLADSAAVHAYRSDRELMRFQSWKPEHESEVRQFIRGMLGLAPGIPGTWYQFGIVRLADDCLIGDCGIHVPLERVDAAELGLTLARAHHGRGYATESLNALISYCFDTLHLRSILARIAKDNAPSFALTQRCGFTPAAPSAYDMAEEEDEGFLVLERASWRGGA
ncbi:MAG: GNAT family N-acetyltransferase [Bacteroidota bacterium]|nr:GNAT family N-acetyltransferase [Bacteroidota bacterium]